MDITFASPKLEALSNSHKELVRAYGIDRAKKIQRRLIDLRAFTRLSDVPNTPPFRCHLLKGNLAGKFAIDTIHPYRIIFEPAHNPVPLLPDGSIDKTQITAIRILDINKDYHD